eukprot:12989059-Alexandrium_andersonii.AAC.1
MDVAAIDLMKAFDTIPRHILYCVLAVAGFPVRLLLPYGRYHEQLCIYHVIDGHVGCGHARRVSIPQGDPWSMMCCAILMRPVIQLAHLR